MDKCKIAEKTQPEMYLKTYIKNSRTDLVDFFSKIVSRNFISNSQ